MDRSNEMIKGRLVVYLNPNKDEVYQNGDPIVFKIIEDNGDRVLMEPVWMMGIKPSYVALKADLRIAFNQHTDVPVPDFINFDEWQDNSWCNDETASVIKKLDDKYNIRFWIYTDEFVASANKDNPDPKDPWRYFKYVVCIEDEDGHMTQGRQCETDEDAIKTLEEFKKNWLSLVETEEWA